MPGSKKSFKNNVSGADKLFSVNDAEYTSYTKDVSGALHASGALHTSGAQGVSDVSSVLCTSDVQGVSDARGVSDVLNVLNVSDVLGTSDVQDVSGALGTLDALSVSDVLGVRGVLDTQDTSDISFESDIKKLKSNYRFNLKLEEGYREYIQEAAWLSRMTITEYLNNLIKEDKERRANTKSQN